MRVRRSRLIALAVVTLALVVALVWLFASGNQERGEEDEEAVSAPAPQLAHGPKGQVIVTLSREEQAQIGLETETLTPAAHTRELTAYGLILDPLQLASLNAQLISQAAAVKAARAEYARARLLYSERQNVSLKNLQMAQVKYQTGNAQLSLLRQQLASQWGAQIAAMEPVRRSDLVNGLAARTVALARVSLPADQSFERAPTRAWLTVLGYGSQRLLARSVWNAPSVNPNLQGRSFLLLMQARGFPLRPGAAVTVYLQSSAAPQRGVVIPDAATVSTAGGLWAYIQIAPTRFERRLVALNQPAAGGWFVAAGFAPGDRVVAAGAQALLSEEFKSAIRIED